MDRVTKDDEIIFEEDVTMFQDVSRGENLTPIPGDVEYDASYQDTKTIDQNSDEKIKSVRKKDKKSSRNVSFAETFKKFNWKKSKEQDIILENGEIITKKEVSSEVWMLIIVAVFLLVLIGIFFLLRKENQESKISPEENRVKIETNSHRIRELEMDNMSNQSQLRSQNRPQRSMGKSMLY